MGACALLRVMEPQDEQRVWLLEVLKRTKLAPTALAIRANLAPTTLTRFLNNPQHASALSARTISAVEKVSGVRFQGAGAVASIEPERVEAKPFSGEIKGGLVANMLNTALAQEGVAVFELSSRALENAGYLPGDMLIVEARRAPEPGDVVAVSVLDWDERPTATVFRIFEPPALISATMDPSLRRPLFQDKHHRVAGVVVAAMRISADGAPTPIAERRVVYL